MHVLLLMTVLTIVFDKIEQETHCYLISTLPC